MKTTYLIIIRIALLLCVVLFFNCSNKAPGAEDDSIKSIKETEQEKTYSDKLTDYKIETETKLDSINIELNELKTNIDEANLRKPGFIFFFIILNIFVLAILTIGSTFLFLRSKRLKENIIKQVLRSKRIEEKFKPNLSQQSNLKNSNSLSDREVKLIDDRVLSQIKLYEKEKKESEVKLRESNREVISHYIEQSFPSKYLKGITNNKFSITDSSPENSFFKVTNEKDDNAQFIFSGVEEEAIAKKVFNDDISKIVSGSYKNSKTVRTITPGEIKRISDYWEVIKPIEIELS